MTTAMRDDAYNQPVALVAADGHGLVSLAHHSLNDFELD